MRNYRGFIDATPPLCSRLRFFLKVAIPLQTSFNFWTVVTLQYNCYFWGCLDNAFTSVITGDCETGLRHSAAVYVFFLKVTIPLQTSFDFWTVATLQYNCYFLKVMKVTIPLQTSAYKFCAKKASISRKLVDVSSIRVASGSIRVASGSIRVASGSIRPSTRFLH